MAHRTVTLKGDPLRYEAIASGAISPGHLVELTNATADTVKVQTSTGPAVERAVALEDELQGNEIGDAYTTANIVQYALFRPGDMAVLRLKNGENAAKGNFLVSAGSGEVAVMVADSSGVIVEQVPIGIAMEGVDMSSSSAVDPSPLIAVRFL